MKYALLNSENDEVLFECESEMINQNNVKIEKNGSVCSVLYEKNDHQTEQYQFLIESDSKESGLFIATSLGSMAVRVQKGSALKSSSAGQNQSKTIKSSMPGKILKILCKVDDTVEVGQSLMIIEAMKMENEIKSSISGKVEKISIQIDQKIETGESLITIKSLLGGS